MDKKIEIAEQLCKEIMSMTGEDILKMSDLLKMTDLCMAACKREKAVIEEMTKPESDILQ